ncbi:HAL/PAL/TAL family ammonia-lyase [Paenibacillus luteus]|uniref:HAL/PAL/TAL family ammonia-lyase n=1 Tax=Paenibacillus luteus TaxID=2545753 RepID=UPI0011418377|nr:aromatic amino acid ammonia-lyase [Paenibacillus luteus]
MTNGQKLRTLLLDGSSLTIEDVVAVAAGLVRVEIAEDAWQRLVRSRQFILKQTESDSPIYGFNRGVGLNKDWVVEEQAFESYNRSLLYAHSAGVEPYASERQVRATLLARLNTLLVGTTGASPELIKQYAEFLNAGIHPLLPSRGSVGAGDITLLSHLGLAFIGEGDVIYKGTRMAAEEALQQAGLQPIRLGAKDGLAIVSSNAAAAGHGALVLQEGERLLAIADLVYALSLEALQGQLTPLDKSVHRSRPYEGHGSSSSRIRSYLKGSSLWSHSTGALQDPLSFRSASPVHGAALEALGYAKGSLQLHLNSSEDNPCVLEDEGRILPSASFEPLAWVLGFEMLGIALSHVSKIACYRTIKLSTPSFTGLPRFLAPEAHILAFSTIQKTFTALDAEIRHLSNPVSADYYSLAGDMEDHSTNAPLAIHKTGEIIDRLTYILAIEAIHAAQAIDLRNGIKLGEGTLTAYNRIREVVPFLDRDRSLSGDIKAAYTLLKTGGLDDQLGEA